MDKWKIKCMKVIRWSLTFLMINILWLLFRAESVTQWLNILKKAGSFQNTTVSDGLISAFHLPESGLLRDLLHLESLSANVRGLWLLIFILVSYLICLIPKNNYRKLQNNNYVTMILAAAAFIWSFLCLSSESVFVYFNF